MKPVKVLIVDDHEVVRLGLKAALEPEDDMLVVGDVGNAEVAVREAEIKQPDVVLMDVRMPGTDGIQACRMIRELLPDVKVVMLTSFSDEQAVFASIMAGAYGYLLKGTRRAELLSAVRTVAKGESLLDSAVASTVLARLRYLTAREEKREADVLSDRENQVLALVAEGMTNKEIAASLVITENTARNHVSRILDKLDLTRRAEAARFAAEHGLLATDKPGNE